MAKSGQITVTTSGTAVQGPSSPKGQSFVLKAHPDNTGTVWFGNNGAEDVSSANGYPLNPGEERVVAGLSLAKYWFDADVNGEKICWLVLL